MENGLVTADGTKILTVEEYDRFKTYRTFDHCKDHVYVIRVHQI
jgi:hypothetical protein